MAGCNENDQIWLQTWSVPLKTINKSTHYGMNVMHIDKCAIPGSVRTASTVTGPSEN